MSIQHKMNSLLSLLVHKKIGKNNWLAQCPCPIHKNKDRNPSLSLAIKNDSVIVLHCHAGGDPADILSAVGLDFDALFPDRPAKVADRGPGRCFYPTDVYERMTELFILGTFILKSGDREALLRVVENLNELNFAYHFTSSVHPGAAQEVEESMGDDHE